MPNVEEAMKEESDEYVICAVCGKKYKGIVPKGGDGSALFPRKHKAPQRESGTRIKETCPGSWVEGKHDRRI